jgi:hypothetical protein
MTERRELHRAELAQMQKSHNDLQVEKNKQVDALKIEATNIKASHHTEMNNLNAKHGKEI